MKSFADKNTAHRTRDAVVTPGQAPEKPVTRFLWALVALAFIAATVAMAYWTGRPKPLKLDVSGVGGAGQNEDLRIDRIRAAVRALAAPASRMTGYPGNETAVRIILDSLKNAGITETYVQEFQVAVPYVESATLTARTASGPVVIRLHPLWPNLARTSQTSEEGITGPLVDVGKGTDADLAGKELRGAVAVMDWDSRNEWLAIPEFGGRAVLFRANPAADGSSARSKFLTVPANVPRFYVAAPDLPTFDRLLATPGVRVTIRCKMFWKRAAAKNILARVPGDDAGGSTGEPIIFHAYYDSVSVVPDLAPGAEQACGAATLLELARYFRGKGTDHPVYVLFTGAHGQAFEGMIRFVRLLRDGLDRGWPEDLRSSLPARMGRPALFVGLDLSSHSDRFGVFSCGRFRGQYESRLRPQFSTLGLKLDQFAKANAPDRNEAETSQFVDCINLTLGRGWWTYFPYQAPFESEVPTTAVLPGITLSTINDARRTVDTPDDTVERVDFGMLERQLLRVPGKRIGLANIALALAMWQGPYVSNISQMTNRMARLDGRVVWLDQERDYTANQPLNRAVVFLKTQRGDKYLCGTRGGPVVLTDAKGHFQFDGLIQSLANGQFDNCLLEAYGLASGPFIAANPRAVEQYHKVLRARGARPDLKEDGAVFYALDMARAKEYPWQIKLRKLEQSLNLVCFPCKSVTLYGLTDPREYMDLKDVQILDAATESPPFEFGHSATDLFWGNPEENCTTVWGDPTLNVRITLGFGFQKKRLILINNSPENPIGVGFKLDELDGIPSMVLQGGNDMWTLDDSRLRKLREQGIGNPRIEKLHAEAREKLDAAQKALSARDYRTYRSMAENGWALEGKAYGELLSTTNNMIRGVLFYLLLLLPFSYCLERLLFASGTIRRRLIGMISIFAASFAVLAAVHPAFRFTLTPLIVLLAFVILALAGTVTALILGKFDAALRERKQQLTGFHEESSRVGNIAVRAVDLGIANIRRRKQRGILTGMTIVAVTFTLLSFVSIVPELNISRLKHPDGVPDAGRLLARDRRWAPMRFPAFESLRRTFAAAEDEQARGTTAARAWFFSDYSGSLSQIDLSAARKPLPNIRKAPENASGKKNKATGTFTAVALLCLEASEPAVSHVDRTLIAGRWFRDNDERGIILPRHIAACLGLGSDDVGAPVLVFGEKLPLLGIFDSRAFDRIRDIDGEPLTPVNFVLQQQMMAERASTEEKADTLENYVHYPSDQIAIVPFKFGRALGATLRGVAVRTRDGVDAVSEAERFARRSNQTILGSDREQVTLFASVSGSKLSAAGQIGVPILLGFIMVLGTMLGSVYERRREIFVYNSVGLSPTHVASLFLAESSVYATVGACFGYLLGQVVSRVLLLTGALSGLSLNYSAGATVFVTALTMLIVLGSTIYPARQAFLAAIPESRKEDALRDEHFATDRVSSFLPFVAVPANIYAMQAYMYEYLDSIQGVTVGRLAVDNLRAQNGQEAGKPSPTLLFRAWLAPFDLGISHDVQLRVVHRPERDVYQYHVTAVRFSGDQQSWRRLTPRFILALRKQLLMWRILPPGSQEEYARQGRQLFGVDAEPASPEPAPPGAGSPKIEARA